MKEEAAEELLSAILFQDGERSLSDILSLEHHGVKGMQWGVRKSPEAAAEKAYRKESNKMYKKATTPAFEKRLERSFGNGLTESQYKALSKDDAVVKKGSTIKRVTNASVATGKDTLYVSTSERDANLYRAVMPNNTLKGALFGKYDGFNEVTYKATRDLVSPSEKARVDAFIHLLDSPEIKLKNGKSITGREWLKRSGYAREVRKMDSTRLGLRFYHDFVASQGMRNSPINSAYFNSLKEKGYNAVVDDHDRSIVSNEPLIVLGTDGNLKNVGVRPLATRDVLDAQRSVEFPK